MGRKRLDSRVTLGRAIKEVRVEMGMTQEALAEKAGLSISTLRHVEQGAIPSPSFQRVTAIAAALGLGLDALARRAGLPTHQEQEDDEVKPKRRRIPVGRLRVTGDKDPDKMGLRRVKAQEDVWLEGRAVVNAGDELLVDVTELRHRKRGR